MNSKIIKRMQALSAQIHHHDYLYYVMDSPEISDREYDALFAELLSLEKAYPELVSPDSPTQRVPKTLSSYLPKAPHSRPMLSLGNSYDVSEIEAFIRRVREALGRDPVFYCELKIDGGALEIVYEDGRLTRAVTRGNGVEGENVTHNIRVIKQIPLVLPQKINISVYGEIYFTRAQFERVNAQRRRENQPVFANPRNAASGTLRALDARETVNRKLSFFAYDLFSAALRPNTQAEVVSALFTLHFPTPPHPRVLSTMSEISAAIVEYEALRARLPFEIDGIVLKVNALSDQKSLGTIARAPKWAVAYKFEAQEATSTILSVDHQVGRTGKITPVANIEATEIGGVIVRRATLHNYEDVNKKDIRDGDTVFIKRAGDVIPAVTAAVLSKRTGRQKVITPPDSCPSCGRPIMAIEKKVAYYCVNPKCPAQLLHKLTHFVSRQAFNIDHLSKKRIEIFHKAGLIRSPEDLFRLKNEEIVKLEGFADKSARNLIESVSATKSIPLHRFVFALGIPLVGFETSRLVAQHFKTLNAIMSASQTALESIHGIGPEVSTSIQKFFGASDNKKWVLALLDAGVRIVPTTAAAPRASAPSPFRDKTIVITGTFEDFSRHALKAKLESLGAKVTSSVSAGTDILLVGADPGSKLDKASALGVTVMDAVELASVLANLAD